METYLAESVANDNKVIGVDAEIRFREWMDAYGFGHRISPGGWIIRNKYRRGQDERFRAVALFPEPIQPGGAYPGALGDAPSPAIQAVGTLIHRAGLECFSCTPAVPATNAADDISWTARRVGYPEIGASEEVTELMSGRKWMKRRTPVAPMTGAPHVGAASMAKMASWSDDAIGAEFAKESLRRRVEGARRSLEVSDFDGLVWGNRHVYPVEIKCKDRAKAGYFGLDLNPFLKLTFFAQRYREMHSVFVVNEPNPPSEVEPNTEPDGAWWIITFEELVQHIPWSVGRGGVSMGGGEASVVQVDALAFHPLRSWLDTA